MIKSLFYSLIFLSCISFISCERCDDDIVVAEFDLTDVAKSNVAMMADTLIYENLDRELSLFTEDGIVLEEDVLYLSVLCSVPFGTEQSEIANTQKKSARYFSESGSLIFEFGVKIKNRHMETTWDSLHIYEVIYADLNTNETEYVEQASIVNWHISDLQNVSSDPDFMSTSVIQDTLLNGVNYSDVHTGSPQWNEFYYTVTEGVVAFEYQDEMWYLKN